MRRVLLQNILNMGWGGCVRVSLNFPRYEVSFYFSVYNQEGGERKEAAKSQVCGEVKSPLPPSWP